MLEQKLMAAARSQQPSDRVPYAFEKRIMALLTVQRLPDTLSLWARALWRAAAPCVGIMLLLAGWSAFRPAVTSTTDLSQELDNTVLAAVNQDTSPDSSW